MRPMSYFQDPSTSSEGFDLLRELLESSRAEMGPWFRLKCCLVLSVHYSPVKEARDLLDEAQLLYDIPRSLPQEKLMESIKEKLLHAPDDLCRAGEWITQQLRALRNADRAERGLTPATDVDESGSDTSSDEDYVVVFLTKLDNAEQSAPAEQPEPAGEPSAEKNEAIRLIPAP